MISSLKRLILLVGFLVVALVGLLAFGVVGSLAEAGRRASAIEQIDGAEGRLRDDPHDRSAATILNSNLDANHPFARLYAARAASRLGSHAVSTSESLIRLVASDDVESARESVIALGKIGHAAARALPALIDAVKLHPDAEVGGLAAESLGAIADVHDAAARDCLNKALAHPRPLLSVHAARGLKRLDDRSLADATSQPTS